MSTYNFELRRADNSGDAVQVRRGFATTGEYIRVNIGGGHVTRNVVLIQNKRSGDVYLASSQELTAAGVPYTGDEDTDEVLNLFPEILERIRRSESGETKTYSLEELAAEYGFEL